MNATSAAISRASPGRRAGMPGRSLPRGSSSSWPVIGVAISPGATALTVIPCCASSSAMTFVSSPSPPFAAQYGALPSSGTCSWIDVTLTIRPPRPAAIMRRAAAWPHRNAPVRSTSSTWRHVSSSTSTNGVESPVPALLTSTSSPPSASASSSTTDGPFVASERSRRRTSARRPMRRTSSAVSFAPASSSCQVMPTSKPSRASATAVARPMPESEPVTMAAGMRRALPAGHDPDARLAGARGRRAHDVELLEQVQEAARVGRAGGALAHVEPVDLFAQGARDRERPGVVQRVLGEGAQHREDEVVEPQHRHPHGLDRELLGALEQGRRVVEALEVPDQVDEHLAVPRLEQPALRRALGAHPVVGERALGAVGVLLADREVEVVARGRPAARPRGHAAGEREGHVGAAERRGGALERLGDLGRLGRRLLACHGGVATRAAGRGMPADMTATNGHGPTGRTVRIAAAGDIHCHEGNREETAAAFATLEERADLVLLAGDLSTHGEPTQAEILADAARDVDLPIFAVLGNHDWHVNRPDEFIPVLEDAGITVLERAWATPCVHGAEIGIVGAKGLVGGFPGSHLPDFGEPLMRECYAETGRDVEAIDAGLRAVAHCGVRIVLLHYAPTEETLIGEPQTIWTMLGSDRLAAPIAAHEPDLVLHGHAHAGTFEGAIGSVPVYNVSVPVMERDFWVFEVAGLKRSTAPVH